MERKTEQSEHWINWELWKDIIIGPGDATGSQVLSWDFQGHFLDKSLISHSDGLG